MVSDIRHKRETLEIQRRDCQRELDMIHEELSHLKMQCEHANRTESTATPGGAYPTVCEDCGYVFHVDEYGGEA
jgi:predicted Zn-ribbon and HTH transcriptional regulator